MLEASQEDIALILMFLRAPSSLELARSFSRKNSYFILYIKNECHRQLGFIVRASTIHRTATPTHSLKSPPHLVPQRDIIYEYPVASTPLRWILANLLSQYTITPLFNLSVGLYSRLVEIPNPFQTSTCHFNEHNFLPVIEQVTSQHLCWCRIPPGQFRYGLGTSGYEALTNEWNLLLFLLLLVREGRFIWWNFGMEWLILTRRVGDLLRL